MDQFSRDSAEKQSSVGVKDFSPLLTAPVFQNPSSVQRSISTRCPLSGSTEFNVPGEIFEELSSLGCRSCPGPSPPQKSPFLLRIR